MQLDNILMKYNKCSGLYPMKCGAVYEGKYIGHPPSKYKSYTNKFPINFNILSQSTKICFKSSLVISVVSSPDSYINRYSYRKSYSIYKRKYPLYFFVGLSRYDNVNYFIYEENNKYNDMIIFDYLSSYYNNSIQFVMSMRWLNKNCKNYRYILSQQSDTFVNIPYFQKYYENNPNNYSLISVIRKNYRVIRNKNSAWYIPLEVYNESDFYPNFPFIPHIILYKDTVTKIINASNYVKTILFMDDVYLGMLLEYSKMSHTLKSLCKMILYFNYTVDINYLKNSTLYIHGIMPGAIYYLSLKIYR